MSDNDKNTQTEGPNEETSSDDSNALDQRGFASMDGQKQRQIASKGGKAAHEKGTAHEFTADEARAAGRKGGVVVSQNRSHMAEIGRKGGESRGEIGAKSQPPPRQSEAAPRMDQDMTPLQQDTGQIKKAG